MTGNSLVATVGLGACVIGFTLIALPDASVSATQPPQKGCVAVVKQEYDSAKRQNLLQTRFSSYVRTGRVGRRYYWYCRA